MLSGLGNSVIHPADYAILSGSVDKSRLGRSFALHTFVGNIGFAAAPPITAALTLLIGWRETLLLVGGVGVPVVLAIVLQSRILNEQKREPGARPAGFLADMRQLLSRPILLFFAFFMVSSMAGAGIQSWLITVLHSTHGLTSKPPPRG
jgi:MFS transporter, FSR family, fosmidomycin resistance protein